VQNNTLSYTVDELSATLQGVTFLCARISAVSAITRLAGYQNWNPACKKFFFQQIRKVCLMGLEFFEKYAGQTEVEYVCV